jgi:hypothetical protein
MVVPITYSQIYRWSARRADAVVVPAEATKRDLHAYYGVPESRLGVALGAFHYTRGQWARPLDHAQFIAAVFEKG